MINRAEATPDMAGKRDSRLRAVVNGGHPGLNPGRQAKLIKRYLNVIDGFLGQSGLWCEFLTWNKRGLLAAFTGGNRPLVDGILNDIAQASGYLEAALVIRTTNTDLAEAGATLHNLGALHSVEEDTISAVTYYKQALAPRREIQDAGGQMTTSHNLALMRYELGHIAKVEELLMEVVEMDQRFELIHLDRDRKTLADVRKLLDRLSQHEKEVKQEPTHD